MSTLTHPPQLPSQSHNEETPSLFSPEILESITADEAKGIYTAERCPKVKKDAIVQLLGRGWAKRRIQELIKVHRLTVNEIELKCCENIDAVRLRIGTRAMRCASDQIERLEENPGLVPGSSIAMTISMLTQTAELLAGRPTSRVEHFEPIDIYSDWPGFIEKQLPPENVREIGLAGEKKPLLNRGEVIDGELVHDGGSDGESVVLQGDPKQASDPVTTFAPARASDQRSENATKPPSSKRPEDPPGGGSADRRDAKTSTHRSARKNFSNTSA